MDSDLLFNYKPAAEIQRRVLC